MRILQVIASIAPRYGGPSHAVLGLAAELAARGHEVEIVTTDRDGASHTPPERFAPDGRVPIHWARAHSPRAWGASAGLIPLLRSRLPGADIVHIHSLYLFHTLAASRMALRRGIPYVVRPHGTLTEYHRARHTVRKFVYQRLIENRTLRAAAFVQATSAAERDHLVDVLPGIRIETIPLGVEVGKKFAPPARNGAPFLLAFVGRLTRKKQPEVMVDAVAELRRRGFDVVAVIAGPEEDTTASELRARAASLGVADHVTLAGLLHRDEVGEILRRCSALVLPSLEENFGFAVGEALAVGRPVVVGNGVALSRAITDEGAGLSVDCNPRAVADAVAGWIEDPEAHLRASEAAHRFAARELGWTRVGAALEGAYLSVVSRPF